MFSFHDLAFALIFKIRAAQNLWVSDQMFDKLLECSVFVIHFRKAKWGNKNLIYRNYSTWSSHYTNESNYSVVLSLFIKSIPYYIQVLD